MPPGTNCPCPIGALLAVPATPGLQIALSQRGRCTPSLEPALESRCSLQLNWNATGHPVPATNPLPFTGVITVRIPVHVHNTTPPSRNPMPRKGGLAHPPCEALPPANPAARLGCRTSGPRPKDRRQPCSGDSHHLAWGQAHQQKAFQNPGHQCPDPSYTFHTRPLQTDGVTLAVLGVAALIALRGYLWVQDGEILKASLLGAGSALGLGLAGWAGGAGSRPGAGSTPR